MPELKNSTIQEIQQYVRELELERGFEKETVLQKCLLLGEEVGELFKVVRKHEKIGIDKNSKTMIIEEELADILIYISAIANRFNIDLEAAFRNKEEINKKRKWD